MSFTIAIDGPAAAGKGTISKAVAAHFGFAHLDTGLLYRAVGKKALETGPEAFGEAAAAELAATLTESDLARMDLRTAEVAQAASRIAVLPKVRSALLDFQRAFARRDGGAVLDGRDIGTVICPDADAKIFVTASDEVRAQRRFAELTEKGHETTLGKVLADLRQRDQRDRERDTAPLKPADDALLLNTSDLSIDAAVAAAISLIEQKRMGK